MRKPSPTIHGRWPGRRRRIAWPWRTCTTAAASPTPAWAGTAEAVADYDRAIENDPDDPVLYRNRAAARLRAGDAAAAEADERKADELEAMRP